MSFTRIIREWKHRDLIVAAIKVGGGYKLGKHLAIDSKAMAKWGRKKAGPPLSPTGMWPEEKLFDLETKLQLLTGKTLEDLFPAKPCRQQLIAVEQYSIETRLRMLQELRPPDMLPGLVAALNKAMAFCRPREASVLVLRYGLNGDRPWTLDEVATKFGFSRERARQLEAAGIRRIQQSPYIEQLAEYLEVEA